MGTGPTCGCCCVSCGGQVAQEHAWELQQGLPAGPSLGEWGAGGCRASGLPVPLGPGGRSQGSQGCSLQGAGLGGTPATRHQGISLEVYSYLNIV